MGHFASMTPHEQVVETLLPVGQRPFYQRSMELYLEPVGNHCHILTQSLKVSF